MGDSIDAISQKISSADVDKGGSNNAVLGAYFQSTPAQRIFAVRMPELAKKDKEKKDGEKKTKAEPGTAPGARAGMV